jgi:hypothetical protein
MFRIRVLASRQEGVRLRLFPLLQSSYHRHWLRLLRALLSAFHTARYPPTHQANRTLPPPPNSYHAHAPHVPSRLATVPLEPDGWRLVRSGITSRFLIWWQCSVVLFGTATDLFSCVPCFVLEFDVWREEVLHEIVVTSLSLVFTTRVKEGQYRNITSD